MNGSSGSCKIEEREERSDETHIKSESCSGTMADELLQETERSSNTPDPAPGPKFDFVLYWLEVTAVLAKNDDSESGVRTWEDGGLEPNVTDASVGSEKLNMAFGRVSKYVMFGRVGAE